MSIISKIIRDDIIVLLVSLEISKIMRDLEMTILSIGEKIAQLRRERNWTQRELADKAGVTQNQVSRIEKGKSRPRTSTLETFAEALGVSVEDLENNPIFEKENPVAQMAQEDPDMAALFAQISLLSPKQREAIKITLSSMISYQKVRQVTKDSVAS